MRYEVHIVGYVRDGLSGVPKTFFVNRVEDSSVGLSGIATFETDDFVDAWKVFEEGCQWSSDQLATTEGFGVHVKLEERRQAVVFDGSVLRFDGESFVNSSPMSDELDRQWSTLLSGWDIHLDGVFDPRLRNFLVEQDWIVLNYFSSSGKNETTVTIHFARERECIDTFINVIDFLQDAGGFEGIAYWEAPLAFQVYGLTVPRPIRFPI